MLQKVYIRSLISNAFKRWHVPKISCKYRKMFRYSASTYFQNCWPQEYSALAMLFPSEMMQNLIMLLKNIVNNESIDKSN